MVNQAESLANDVIRLHLWRAFPRQSMVSCYDSTKSKRND
jgi:hypothetical protein